MKIQELAAPVISLQSELNPDLWDEHERLAPDYATGLKRLADEFVVDTGITNYSDIVLTGSNTGYAYAPGSALVVHVITDVEDDDVYQELLAEQIAMWNKTGAHTLGGYTVELGVCASELHTNWGCYSLLTESWRTAPRRRCARSSDAAVIALCESWQGKLETGHIAGWEKFRESAVTGSVEQCVVESVGHLADRLARISLSQLEPNVKSRDFRYGYQSPTISEDAEPTPDGVNPTTCMFLNERDVPSRADVIREFFQFCCDYLELRDPPRVRLKRDPAWSARNHTFGRYNPSDNSMELALTGRNIMDICRTLSHELVHCQQNERGLLHARAGEDGSECENEANAVAGVIMRQWGKQHPEFFEPDAVTESASGVIPTRKQAKDPRYSMALTVDVQPGETGRQANKLGLVTDKQGRPQTARADGRIEQQLAESWQRFKEDLSLPNENSLGRPIAQTEDALKNFWNWFGNSQSTDNKGRPLVFYHGTSHEFDSFKPVHHTASMFFTPSYEFANLYATSGGSHVIPVYLRYRKIWDYDKTDCLNNLQTYLELSDEDIEWWQGNEDAEDYVYASNGDYSMIESSKFQKFLQANGYDAYTVKEHDTKNVAVYSSNQIKSAIGNRGTYGDSENVVDESSDSVPDWLIDLYDRSVRADRTGGRGASPGAKRSAAFASKALVKGIQRHWGEDGARAHGYDLAMAHKAKYGYDSLEDYLDDEQLDEELAAFKSKRRFTQADFARNIFESFADYRRWTRQSKTSTRGQARYFAEKYQGLFITESDHSDFNRRKSESQEYIQFFKSLDSRRSVAIEKGRSISILSSTAVPMSGFTQDGVSVPSRIELDGFITPKKITNIILNADNQIDTIEFEDGTQWPESAELTTIANTSMYTVNMYLNKESAQFALKRLVPKINQLKAKGWITEIRVEGLDEQKSAIDEGASDSYLWQARVKITQKQGGKTSYTGYIPVTVSAPDMRRARILIAQMYGVRDSDIGSTTKLKRT